jgi:HTH-type transcriptional regulator/antitoxin HigA
MSVITKELQTHWAAISPLLTIHNEEEYNQSVERLNHLIGEIGTDEQHPLYELLDTLGTILHVYEQKHYPVADCSGVEVLQYLMEEHGLSQPDLPEVGSQGVVSDILRGKRELNVRQIRALAGRFSVSPAVFF